MHTPLLTTITTKYTHRRHISPRFVLNCAKSPRRQGIRVRRPGPSSTRLLPLGRTARAEPASWRPLGELDASEVKPFACFHDKNITGRRGGGGGQEKKKWDKQGFGYAVLGWGLSRSVSRVPTGDVSPETATVLLLLQAHRRACRPFTREPTRVR